MKKLLFLLAVSALGVLLTFASFAASTVYVDGVGTDTDCYATFPEATAAVDNGGTVILTANITTRTGSGGETWAAKDITVTSNGSAVLTFGRVVNLGGDTTFENIKIANAASSGLDILYCCGHDLVIGDGVTTTINSSTSRYLIIYAGTGTTVATIDNTITVKSGTWRSIYTGSNNANCSGQSTVNFLGGTITGGGLLAGGLTSSKTTNVDSTFNIYGGTVANVGLGASAAPTYEFNLCGGATVTKLSVPANVDLTNGGKVQITNENSQTVTAFTREGYTVDHTGTVYSVPFAYLDGTGATTGAYTDFKTAVSALPNGGTLFVTGDTTVGSSASGVTLTAVGGKVTVTGQNGAILTLARSLTLASELEFNNITIASASTSVGRFICNGNPITFGAGVTTTPASNGRYPSIIGGAAGGTCSTGSHISIASGIWFVVFGGNFAGTFNGNSVIDITGGTFKGTIVGGSRAGSFTGNATVNIGGSAVVQYGTYDTTDITTGSVYIGVVGGTMGHPNGSATTFTGDIEIHLTGNAQCASNLLGANRYSNVTTVGDITITVEDNAILSRNIYAGGYFGKVTTGEDGIRVILSDNAAVTTSKFVCAGALEASAGDITGTGYVEVNDSVSITGAIYAGGYNGTFDGDTAVVVNGGTVTSTVSAQNRDGSVTGAQSVTLHGGAVGPVKGDVLIDLAAGDTVAMQSCDGTVTTQAPEGYEVLQSGITYYTQELGAEPVEAPTTVYVDGTGATPGAYTNFGDAFMALSTEGGTVIVCGDTELGSTTAGFVMGTYNTFSGKVTITSENDAQLIFARSLRINTEVEFDDIHIHSIIPTSLGAVNNIICCGNTLTIGSGVTVTCESGKLYPCLIGGQDAATTYDSHLYVYGGTWRNIWGGGYNNTFDGDSYVVVSGATVQNILTAGSREGTHNGTQTLTLDLRGGKTVSATTFGEIDDILVDSGYEAVLVNGTYREELPTAGVSVEVTGADAFIDKEGKGNVRVVTAATVPSYKSVTGFG
ncbi:MAG: hypothetical protein IJU41_07380, partial [Clostridia bacterium]|nr:hypothetical protein [Clostridia bacterium]